MDNKISNIDLICSIVEKGLFSTIDFTGYDEIIVDLDSVLSILLRENLDFYSSEDKKMLISKVLSSIRDFVSFYVTLSKVTLIYNMEKYKKFTEIYPDWCKERQIRYTNESVKNLLHKFIIKKLETAAEKSNKIDVIKTEDSPILYIYDALKYSDKKYLIISRDPHIICLFAYYDINIFNGRYTVNRNNYYLEKEYPHVHYTLIPACYLLAGIKRNEYSGIKGYSIKKASDLINKNKALTVKGELEQIKQMEQYKKIFYLNLK